MSKSLNDVMNGLVPVTEKVEVTKANPLVKVWEGPKSVDYPEQGIKGSYNFSTAVKLDKVPDDSKIVDSLWKLGPGKRVKAGKVYLELSPANAKMIKEGLENPILSEAKEFRDSSEATDYMEKVLKDLKDPRLMDWAQETGRQYASSLKKAIKVYDDWLEDMYMSDH